MTESREERIARAIEGLKVRSGENMYRDRLGRKDCINP